MIWSLPVRLTRRGWAFLGTAALCWLAWTLIGLRDLWALVAFLAALVLLALVWVIALPALARLEVQVSATDPTPTAGDPVGLIALVRNRAFFGVHCEVLWRVGETDRTERMSIGAASAAVSELEWKAAKRGLLAASVQGFVVFDPLGLAVRRVVADAHAEILVLPRKLDDFSIELLAASRTAGLDGLAGSSAVGGDSGERAGSVRAYRSGDPLRLIHWKQSARQGDLLVSLRESAGVSERSLVLAVANDAYHSGDEFDRAVSAAATLAAHWLEDGYPVRLTLEDAQPLICTNEADMLRALAVVRMLPASSTVALAEVFPPPQAVVAGIVGERLAGELAKVESRGVLLALSAAEGVVVPRNWRALRIPDE